MGGILPVLKREAVMAQIWVTFRSLTHAQRASRILERKGYTSVISRIPQGLSPKGCGYALILRRKSREALRLLEGEGIPIGMIFEKSESGEFREVTV